MNRALKILLIIIIVVIVLPSLTGKQYLYKAVYHNFANIDDYTIFDNDTVSAGSAIFPPDNFFPLIRNGGNPSFFS